jgi:hypothetical protein
MPQLYAFFASVSAGASNVQLNAVTGTAEYVQNNRLVLDRDRFLLWAYVRGANITNARIDSPSLRVFMLPRLPLVHRSTTVGNQPPVNDFSGYGLVLRAREEIAMQTSNDLATGTENHYAIICVGEAAGFGQRGPEFWIRTTGNTTLTANTWTNVPLSFEQALPAGRYRVVSMIPRSATGIAARLIIPGQAERHGTLCINAVGQEPNRFLYGTRYGDFGTFESTALPSVEFFASGADTTQEVYLGLVRA